MISKKIGPITFFVKICTSRLVAAVDQDAPTLQLLERLAVTCTRP